MVCSQWEARLAPKFTLHCPRCDLDFIKTGWIIGPDLGFGWIPHWVWYYVKCHNCNEAQKF